MSNDDPDLIDVDLCEGCGAVCNDDECECRDDCPIPAAASNR